MKRIIVIATALVMVLGIGNAFAAGSNSLKAGTFGLSYDVISMGDPVDNLILGRYLVANDLAVLGGFGFASHGGDAKGTDLSLAAGIRKYLKTDDLAPFAGGFLEYRVTNDSNDKFLSLFAQFGAEYFLGKQFSLDASVGFGYTYDKTPGTGKDTTIGTARSGIGFNYYF